MAIEINLNNSDEFQDMIDRKDFTIAKAVVETILANLNTRKKHLHVLSVNCVEDGATYDITLERRYFEETLQENLKYYVEKELYEECTQIVEAINQLKEKTDGNKSTNTQGRKNKKEKTK
jgi:predicted house-cleaning noncanonical NTP pyrophosphatase (MazG superfamily)